MITGELRKATASGMIAHPRPFHNLRHVQYNYGQLRTAGSRVMRPYGGDFLRVTTDNKMQTWISPAQLTERRKQAKPLPHKPCCRCNRSEGVTFAKRSPRCTDCNAEAQRISRGRTGKRPPTMIG